MKPDDAIGEIELRIPTPHARHVAVDNRAEFLARFCFEVPRLFAFIRDELAGEHTLAAERILVTSRNG